MTKQCEYRYEIRNPKPGEKFYTVHIWRDGQGAGTYSSYVNNAFTVRGGERVAKRWIKDDAKGQADIVRATGEMVIDCE